MKPFLAIVQKELRLYWNSPIAYVFIIAFLGISFWFFFRTFFIVGQTEMRSFFNLLPWIYLFLIPALTMRMWSEEYKQGTIETLLTSSLSYTKIILGKFLASLTFLCVTLAATLVLPLSLATIGNLDEGTVFVGYIGAVLLGALYISIGTFISATTNNQIVAFIISVLTCFILFILGEPIVTFSLPGIFAPILKFIGVGSHYDTLVRGVIDTKDVLYYISTTALFLYFNLQILVLRK